MEKEDFSRHIFNTFYTAEGRLLQVVLKNKTVLSGTFIGFFHGEKDTGDPYIIKWHFLHEDEMASYQASPLNKDERDGKGVILKQEDIESVTFK